MAEIWGQEITGNSKRLSMASWQLS
jgi:hypothetical protein